MNSSASQAAAASSPQKASQATAEREVRLTTTLIVGALLAGLVLQVFIPPGGLTLVAAAFLASMVVVAIAFVSKGKLRQTIAGFRFIATLLFVLAVMAVLGTLILQLKPAQFYFARYGTVGRLIVALRFDDIFHGLPFALLMALFGASVIASATLRWPLKLRSAGFFICHVGLMTSLAGAAASATLALRGRIDLHAGGETATHVNLTKANAPTGERAALGFDLHLDQFDLVNYEPEYRIGYYEVVPLGDGRGQWQLKASFDPDLEKHRLPGGDSYRLSGIYPDFKPVSDPNGKIGYATASQDWKNPAVVFALSVDGRSHEQLAFAASPQPAFLAQDRALVFERREKEVKAYVSHVTAARGESRFSRKITVNDPMTYGGWTLYQVNYRPEDPTYSGLEAVYDPGVFWVFLGFSLICVGVFYMFYVEPRFKARAPSAQGASLP